VVCQLAGLFKAALVIATLLTSGPQVKRASSDSVVKGAEAFTDPNQIALIPVVSAAGFPLLVAFKFPPVSIPSHITSVELLGSPLAMAYVFI
jgi:hypothetical protein